MSEFSENSINMARAFKALECTILGQQECTFSINSTINDLAELAFFLGLAIDKKVCVDETMLRMVSYLRTQLIQIIKETVPAFETVNFDDLEKFKNAQESGTEVAQDPAIISIFNDLLQRFEEIENRLNN